MPKEDIEQDFPQLVSNQWRATSEIDPAYNCVAFALRDTKQFWDPGCIGVRGYYWPPGVPREDTIQAWTKIFIIHGFEHCETGELEPSLKSWLFTLMAAVFPIMWPDNCQPENGSASSANSKT